MSNYISLSLVHSCGVCYDVCVKNYFRFVLYWWPRQFLYQMMFVSFYSALTGSINKAGTAYPPRAPEFIPWFSVSVFVLCMVVSNTYCIVFFVLFVFVLLPVSLDCPCLIVLSVSLTFLFSGLSVAQSLILRFVNNYLMLSFYFWPLLCQLKLNWHLHLLDMYMNLICTWGLIET